MDSNFQVVANSLLARKCLKKNQLWLRVGNFVGISLWLHSPTSLHVRNLINLKFEERARQTFGILGIKVKGYCCCIRWQIGNVSRCALLHVRGLHREYRLWKQKVKLGRWINTFSKELFLLPRARSKHKGHAVHKEHRKSFSLCVNIVQEEFPLQWGEAWLRSMERE